MSMQPVDTSIPTLSPLKRALLAVEEMQRRVAEMERARQEPIAIVGLSCRFPGAPNPQAFWDLLENGRDAVSEVPPSRWHLSDYFSADVDEPGKMSTRWGGFLDQVDQFDPEFFGISPREAMLMDPQQRLLLEVAWEALENAAQGPTQWVTGKTGVFIGITGDEYAQRIFRSGDPALFNAYFASGIARSVAGGRISYTLGIEGPNFSIDTACSSSLVAVHNACVYLRTGQCRMALAGGVNVILSPEIGITFSKAHMMAVDGRCKAFDSRADGFVRAEGCGVVVLKRLSDAIADRDRILAVIRGSAINQDGRSSGLTVPNVNAQEAVIRDALAVPGMAPGQVDYIEAHGTGTALGDPIEARALSRVFAEGRPSDHPLVVGSVKTNLGHLESAAGIAGLIKTVLSLEKRLIPGNLHFQEMNPHIDWGNLPVEIPVQSRPWPRAGMPRTAGVSAFGFSGTNAHVILEEAPDQERSKRDQRPLHVLTLSARSQTALQQVVERFDAILRSPDADAGNICFAANSGRSHFANRIAVAGDSTAQLRSKLLAADLTCAAGTRDSIQPVFLFPGQGSQFAGMGKELYLTHRAFRQSLDQCAELLGSELAVPLLDVLWGSSTHLLDETAYTQPALFAIEYALAELWKSWGIQPTAVLGHSIGEYAAACIAGVYSLADGLKLIAARGRLMQSVAGRGAMVAAAASEQRVREVLNGLANRVAIAALNAPESIVISGYADAVEMVEAKLRSQGVRVQRLAVSHAFHSPQMDEMADQFASVAAGIRYNPPRIKWISSLTGRAMGRNDAADPSYWRRQVREPVRFRSAIESLDSVEYNVFLEVGPGTTLSALGPQSTGRSDQLWLSSLKKNCGEWQQILDSLSRLYTRGAEVNWCAFEEPYQNRRVQLPTYPFERQHYWFEAAQPAKPMPGAGTTADVSRESAATAPSEQLYEVTWHPCERAGQSGAIAGEWLVVADQTGVAQQFTQRLSESGAHVTLVRPSEIRAAVTAKTWAGIVYLPALDAPDASELSPEKLESCQREICGGLLDLVHGLESTTSDKSPRLWLVTRGAQALDGDRTVALGQSTLWGFAQAITEEHPEWNCRCVDLDPNAGEECAHVLLEEIAAVDGEELTAWRGENRFAMRIVPRSVGKQTSAPAHIHADATYLITGGFGALGRRTAEWLISQGARHLAVAGRSGPPAVYREFLASAQSRGIRIATWQADISRFADAQRLISEITATLPPLRGVFHTAGVLDDATLVEQNWSRFATVFAPKVTGSWILHQLTKSIPLDYFILFSSIAAVMGAPGQANYAAANAFQDSLAHYRRRNGLPATSIAWGAWSEGMAGRHSLTQKREAIGILSMATGQALQLLRSIVESSPEHVLAGAFDWGRFVARYNPRPCPGRFRGFLPASSEEKPAAGKSELLRQLAGAGESMKIPVLREHVRALAVRILGFGTGYTLDDAQPLQELGLDSLMAVEFRNALSSALERPLPATLLFSFPAVDDLTRYIADLLWGKTLASAEQPVPHENDYLDQLEQLSDEELDRLLAEKLGTSK